MKHFSYTMKSGPSGLFIEIFCTGIYKQHNEVKGTFTEKTNLVTCKECLEKMSVLDILE